MNKILLIILVSFSSAISAQTIYEHDLDEQKLNELKQNIRHLSKKPEQWTFDSEKEYKEALREYEQKTGKNKNGGYDKESAYESEEVKRNIDESASDRNFDFPKANLGPIGQIILYILLGAILVVLIYFLFINSNLKKNGAKYVPLDIEAAAPANIPKTELERLLEAALREQNYRKVIRVYYLFILKDLSEKQWINWEKQKTNIHYIQEMQTKKEAEDFSTVVTYFEFIWYGKRNISKIQFESIQPNFTELLNALNIK